MKTLQLTDEEFDAVKCALQTSVAQCTHFSLRSTMQLILIKMDRDEGIPSDSLPKSRQDDYKTVRAAMDKLHQAGATSTAERAWDALERLR